MLYKVFKKYSRNDINLCISVGKCQQGRYTFIFFEICGQVRSERFYFVGARNNVECCAAADGWLAGRKGGITLYTG